MNIKILINNFLSNKYLATTVTVIIFILCTWPSEHLPLTQSLNDKTAHFIAFAGWAFCWQCAFGNYKRTIILGILYGILIEFWQGILPESFHRSFDWYDALADSIGVIIGIVLWRLKALVNL